MSEYCLCQRVKPVGAPGSPFKDDDSFVAALKAHHAVMQSAMKAKQSTEAAAMTALRCAAPHWHMHMYYALSHQALSPPAIDPPAWLARCQREVKAARARILAIWWWRCARPPPYRVAPTSAHDRHSRVLSPACIVCAHRSANIDEMCKMYKPE